LDARISRARKGEKKEERPHRNGDYAFLRKKSTKAANAIVYSKLAARQAQERTPFRSRGSKIKKEGASPVGVYVINSSERVGLTTALA